MRIIGRFRYSLRGLLIAMAILAVGSAYTRIAIREYMEWEPNLPVRLSSEDEEKYVRRQRVEKIGSLALPPILLGAGLLVCWWTTRKRYGPDAVIHDTRF